MWVAVAEMTNRIWLDVEDIFEYAAFNQRPTGIQRLQFELCRALVELDPAGDRIGFLRHDQRARSFRVVPWDSVQTLFRRMQGQAHDATPAQVAAPPDEATEADQGRARGGLKRTIYRLPPGIRQPLVQYLVQQRGAAVSLGDLLRACARAIGSASGDRMASVALAASEDFKTAARPGDVVLVLGAIWYHPDYVRLIETARADGLRFALLVNDLIPLRRPEWCDTAQSRLFRIWFHSVVGLADQVFSISRASAADIERYAVEHDLPLHGRVAVIPLGTGFEKAAAPKVAVASSRPLPPAGSYALIVSTLEVRKNHMLLFRVWRRLLDEMPRDRVPTLVFAGRVGWMVGDLLAQLRACAFLDGKILLLENPSDAELERLYEGCLFTLFPSFFEGWGLPVTESLSFGRPCVISNATSLPEAGGALARYFDPDNTTEAHDVIRDVLRHPETILEWQDRVAREFRPVSWRETAEAVLRVLQPALGS